MSAIVQASSRKMHLLRLMEHQAEEFTVRLLRQLRPAFHASLDHSELAKSKNTLEYAARHMCEIFFDDKFDEESCNERELFCANFSKNYNALTVKIEEHNCYWGFSGFEFIDFEAAGSSAVLQFNSSQLQHKIKKIVSNFPKIQIRLELSGNGRKYFFIKRLFILPDNFLDISSAEQIIHAWDQWIDESSVWLKG